MLLRLKTKVELLFLFLIGFLKKGINNLSMETDHFPPAPLSFPDIHVITFVLQCGPITYFDRKMPDTFLLILPLKSVFSLFSCYCFI